MTRSARPSPPGPPGPPPAGGTSTGQRRGPLPLAVWVVSLGQLVAVLDTTIVNIALPHLQSALGFSGTSLEWVINAYSLCFGGLLLLGGRTADILGRRRVFIAGVTVFTAASLIGGLALAQWWLLAARAAQGAGAAFAVPSALALIADTFPGQAERRRAVGIFTAIGAGGGAFGILLGGLLTTFVNWRAVFFVNVPIGVAILLAAPRVLASSPPRRSRFDLVGALTGTGAITLLVYTLISGATGTNGVAHWQDPAVLASGAAAVALGAAFIVRESRFRYPLVPLWLFARRARSGAYAITTCIDSAMFGNLFFLTLFLQRVWDYSPLATAAVYIPPALMLTAGGPVASRLITRTGPKRLVIIGLTIAAAGMYGMSRMAEHGHYLTGMLAPTVIGYAGLALTRVPLLTTALARVPEGTSGVASGVYSTARQVGGATGLAVVGAFAWTVVAATVSADRPGAVFGTPGLPAPVVRQAMAAGADRGFLAAAVIVLIGLVIAVLTIGNESASAEGKPSG